MSEETLSHLAGREIAERLLLAGEFNRIPDGAPAIAPASKIRLLRYGRAVVDAERVQIVLGADVFGESAVHTIVLPQRLPGRVERVRIVDRHEDFQLGAVLDQPPAFRDVQLSRMRRAVIVEEGLVVEADGVDDERVALVMADRISVPGGFRIGR